MTLIELQQKLGEQVDLLSNPNASYQSKKAMSEIAQTISSLAKQMINNADVILRTEKLVSDGKMKHSNIVKMIEENGKS